MKILVTGGAGFIGSHLCERLLNDGHSVYCLDNMCDFYNPDIKYQNISNCQANDRFIFRKLDIRDYNELSVFFQATAIDTVVHLAAMAGVRPSIQNPDLYYDVNVRGTLNLLKVCEHNKIQKLVLASSSSVYGNSMTPFRESFTTARPLSPYAASKIAGESLCHTWHHIYDMSVICLRFFTVYGPRQRPDLAIHKFARKILDREPIEMFGTGQNTRDYTYIDDIIAGIVSAVNTLEDSGAKLFEIVNLGNSSPISLAEMINVIEDKLGLKADINQRDMQDGDVDTTYADVSKAQALLGYGPSTSFKDGIGKFVDWLRDENR